MHSYSAGFYPSRSRARDAILRGTVSVDGEVAAKPAQNIAPDAKISVHDDAREYVSRGALKLMAALDDFKLDPKGLDCLDIGASTGGFTQVLLERGARHVTAIDVGHGQMADMLRNDPRVTVIEGLNARDITREHLSPHPAIHHRRCELHLAQARSAGGTRACGGRCQARRADQAAIRGGQGSGRQDRHRHRPYYP